MRRLIKANLKTGAAICAVLACLGPTAIIAQTPPTASPSEPTATPLVPRADPCSAHVVGEKQGSWTSDNYMCEIRADLIIPDQVPRGIPGGVAQRIVVPSDFFSQTITVYHDDKRIYGLKFTTITTEGADETETPVIGGTAGTASTVELTSGMRLHAIRPQFGPDPAKHYRTPVMVGLDIGVYKSNPLAAGGAAPSTGPVSHNDLIEVRRFGVRDVAPNRVAALPKLSDGFDVHLVQVIRSIQACVSPLDRNGRIFSLGVTTGGMGPRQNPNADFCPTASYNWASQPLGPKRIVGETLGNVNPYKFTRGETDQYDFASGIYTKEGEQAGVVPATIGATTQTLQNADDYRGARYTVPQSLLVDFGDTAWIAFGNRVGPVNNLPLITDPARLTRNGTRFDYAYGSQGFFLGVELETIRDKTYAFVTFETTDPNGRYLNGRYQEARLGDQIESVVAKRERDRPGVVASKESKASLFSLGTTQTGYGYVYSGYDAASMSAFDPNPGRMAAIFAESGRYQYHLSSVRSKAVNDGLLMQSITNGHSEKTQTILSSESEVADTLSRSFSADINVRGVKAGAKYATTQARSLTRMANSMIGFATAQYNDFALMLDRPNAFLTDGFTLAARKLYQETNPNVRARLATDMINRFGTHFPQAVIFGGMGTLMTEISAESYAAKREKSTSISATVGVEIPGKTAPSEGARPGAGSGGTAEFTQSQTQTNNNSNSSSLETARWRSRGGGGTLNAEGWNVGEGNSVPIYYDLRPLYELIEPIVMSKVLPAGDLYEVSRATLTRDALKAAIEAHFAQFPLPSTVSNKRALWKLTIEGLSCDHAGGDSLLGNSLFLGGGGAASVNLIQLFGKLDIIVTAEGKDQALNLFNSPSVTSDLKCDNSVDGSFLTRSSILTYVSAGGTAPYLSVDTALFEDDDSFTDPDDKLDGKLVVNGPTAMGPTSGRVLISGDMLSTEDAGNQGRLQKPKVYLNYVWERLD